MQLEKKITKPIILHSELPSFNESIEEGLRSERINAIKQLKKRSTLFHLDLMTFVILVFIVGTSGYVSKWPWILPAAIALFLWNYTRSVEKRLEALILLSDVDSNIDPKPSHQNQLPAPSLIFPCGDNPQPDSKPHFR